MYEPAWQSCNRCESVLAYSWDVCPMCGADHLLGRPPIRGLACSARVAKARGWCPDCGQQLVTDPAQ